MVTIQRHEELDEMNFSFEEISKARNAFLQAVGETPDDWVGRIKKRLQSMEDRRATSLTFFQRLVILRGLGELIAGAAMQRSVSHAYAAAYIKFFMRAYDLADEKGRKSLIGKWKAGLKQEEQLVEFFFELTVGILYSQWGNSAQYHDLGHPDSRFDWLINPGANLEFAVEAKSTAWTTNFPMSAEMMAKCRDRIGRFIQLPKIAAFEGVIRIDYGAPGAVDSDEILKNLDSLLGIEKPKTRRVAGNWSLSFLHRHSGFNAEHHDSFRMGYRPHGYGLDILIADAESAGPVCGISFWGRWNHTKAILDNLKKALSQVKGAKMSAVWIQMSGMPISKFDLFKETFLTNIAHNREYERYYRYCQTDRETFAGFYLALDPQFTFESDTDRLQVLQPSIFIPNSLNMKLALLHHFEVTKFKPTPGKNPMAYLVKPIPKPQPAAR
jgi:hypothetical protein